MWRASSARVGRLQQRVQLGQALHARDRHEVAPAEAPDLALDTALLVRAPDPGLAEERVEAEVRAQCGEALALDAVASGEHARHGRLEIVVADPPRYPAEAPEGERVALEERLLALAREAHVNRPSRVREPHQEHRELGQHAVEPDADPAEVGFRLLARGMQLGDGHLGAAGLELAAQPADAGTDRRLGDRRAVLIDEPLPDPPRRVPLLARRAQVGDEPLPDDLHVRTELRRRSGRLLALRRQRRLQRLPYRAPVHVVAARQLAYGQPLLSPCPSDMLEQLHPRHTPLLSLGGGLSRPSVAAGWVGGGASSEDQNGSRWGQIRVAFPVLCGKGTSHSMPLREPCVGRREATREASVAGYAGGAIEHRKGQFGVPMGSRPASWCHSAPSLSIASWQPAAAPPLLK